MTMIDEPQETRLRLIHRRAREYPRDIAGGLFLPAERFCILTSSENDGVALWWSRADLEAFEGRMEEMVARAARCKETSFWGRRGRDELGVYRVNTPCFEAALAQGWVVTPKLAAEYRAQQEGSGEAAVEPPNLTVSVTDGDKAQRRRSTLVWDCDKYNGLDAGTYQQLSTLDKRIAAARAELAREQQPRRVVHPKFDGRPGIDLDQAWASPSWEEG